MKVYKFGGASVQNADSVRNLGAIVGREPHRPLVLVVSAMGKMTNALEEVAEDANGASSALQTVLDFHLDIARDLMGSVPQEVNDLLSELVATARQRGTDKSAHYDQIVAFGELLSTQIIALWLRRTSRIHWKDARRLVVTDDRHQSATVQWSLTESRVREAFGASDLYITQGFIGGTTAGATTTLGREGSDFTAAVLAHCLGALDVTVWKDVPGIMNADPKVMPGARKIDFLSYDEVTEMAYFGAKVIHAKTLAPLAKREIPLYVRSFLDPQGHGSVVGNRRMSSDIACFLYRYNQVLVTLRSQGSALLPKSVITELLYELRRLGITTNLFQHSALSFSFCFDLKPGWRDALVGHCEGKFDLYYNEGLHLAT
ncbi:MAG: aspartate kinase, partial [Bacteroidota bacterium]